MPQQGYKNIGSTIYVYQEQTASAAMGIDTTNSNAFTINTSSVAGAFPGNGSSVDSIVAETVANGDLIFTPKGIGNIVCNNVYGVTPPGVSFGVVLVDNAGALGSTGTGATGTVLVGDTAGIPFFTNTPTVTSITILDMPVNPTDGTNKAYVDSIASGFTFINSAFAASIAPLTVTYANGAAGVGATLTNAGAQATFTLDGTSPTVAQRVLIKDQASTFQNGIYTVTDVGSGVTNWVLTRATDYDEPSEINPGDLVPVTAGTVNAGTSWLQTETVVTIGTDPIIFIPFTLNGSSFLLKANNLSDVANAATSRTNLGLTNVAIQNVANHAVLVGGVSDAITSLTVGNTGQVLVGASGADPVFSALGTNSGLATHGVVIAHNNSAFTAVTNGTTGQVLNAVTGSDPVWGGVSLTTGVTGVLPIANGGTNASSMTNTNGVNYFDGTRIVTTTVGTAGNVLTSNGAGVAPTFQPSSGGSGGTIITTFNTPGGATFNKNASTKSLEVYGWGGGSAGGAGGGSAGGGGGGCGGAFYYALPATFVSSSVSITVGTGGIAGVTPNGTATFFGNIKTIQGNAGVPNSGTAGNGSNGLVSFIGNEISFTAPQGPVNNFLGNMLGTGGGAGSNFPSGSQKGGDVVQAGGSSSSGVVVLAGGTASGGNGNPATSTLNFLCGGTGGGGGNANSNGGNGAFPSGGGGGGGGTTGLGGNGAAGLLIVIEYL